VGFRRALYEVPELVHIAGITVTTLTINHIPVTVSKRQFVALLDQTGFGTLYNYLYLPCNHAEGTNRGHAFVNFCTPEAAKSFFRTWHGARLSCRCTAGASDSASFVVSIAVGAIQGFEACTARWTTARLARLKSADFAPFIAGGDTWLAA
jgi:hypothetical protein